MTIRLVPAADKAAVKASAVRADDRSAFLEPLRDDETADSMISLSHRSLARVVLVASETAACFARSGNPHDPVAWMLSPRRMFGGVAPIEACLNQKDCLRAIMLHRLGLGLDADPGELDELLSDGDHEGAGGDRDRAPHMSDGGASARVVRSRPRLYTATLAEETGQGMVQAFDAAVVESEEEMRARIGARLGPGLAEAAVIVEGFSPGAPLVDAFVTDAMADMLSLVAADPGSPLAAGLDVVLEQRFSA